MNSQKSLLALGSVALAAALVTGCSMTTSAVPPAEGQGVIAAWENKQATVECGKNKIPVYKDGNSGEQECYKPPKSRKLDPVEDEELLNKYPCTGRRVYLAYSEGNENIVLCFESKYGKP
jgi:hypothetical protein